MRWYTKTGTRPSSLGLTLARSGVALGMGVEVGVAVAVAVGGAGVAVATGRVAVASASSTVGGAALGGVETGAAWPETAQETTARLRIMARPIPSHCGMDLSAIRFICPAPYHCPDL